jgi:hypothetical protein
MSATRLLDTAQAAESLGLPARTLEENLAAWMESRKSTSTKEEKTG